MNRKKSYLTSIILLILAISVLSMSGCIDHTSDYQNNSTTQTYQSSPNNDFWFWYWYFSQPMQTGSYSPESRSSSYTPQESSEPSTPYSDFYDSSGDSFDSGSSDTYGDFFGSSDSESSYSDFYGSSDSSDSYGGFYDSGGYDSYSGGYDSYSGGSDTYGGFYD